MKSLFPEIENEIREDRLAARREQRQRARDYLRNRDFSWTVNRLLEKGPQTECQLLLQYMEEVGGPDAGNVINDLMALWRVGKLWRRCLGYHAGAGCNTYLFGIRRVHSSNIQLSSREATQPENGNDE